MEHGTGAPAPFLRPLPPRHLSPQTMSDEGGQVTLIFYKLADKWWTEPFLNIVAAAAQMSSFTHVEVAIGCDAGSHGEMTNVCRIFNDSTGVELTARTGRNPQ